VPPVASKHKDVRYFRIREGDELDEGASKAQADAIGVDRIG